jgi:AcrR family transcriptional regulator
MAKVSQEHLDARRRQILDGARRAFVRNGFHATSMQDVFAEVGLSAGAVYRYFGGKDEIVAAIATEAIGRATESFRAVVASDPPPPLEEVVRALVKIVEELDEDHGATRLALQVWGEASRSPVLADVFSRSYGDIRERFTTLARRYQKNGSIDPDVPPEAVAKVLTGLVPGFVMQRALLGDVDADEYAAGVAALVRTPVVAG